MKGVKGFQRGEHNPTFGKKPHNFGKSPTLETLRKLSDSHKGYVMPQSQREKISLAIKGKPKPPRSLEHRRKIGNSKRGEKSSFWIDGRSRKKNKYPVSWTDTLRDTIRVRDGFLCQECGLHQDELMFGQVKKLDVHHIDYNKDNVDEANLISLCRACHVKTNSNREYWFNYFRHGKI